MANIGFMMRGQALLLLGILVGLGILVALAAGVKEEAPFDLFLLVWTYSPGYCIKQAAKGESERCTETPVSAFTLHGLWPEYEDEREVFTCKRRYKDQSYPECCKTAKPPGPLPPASDEMRCKWESFKGSDAEFWEYEWVKHGTCAEPVLGNRPSYFQTVLELDDKYDLDVALAKYNVTPSDTHSYAVVDLLKALSASYNASVVLECGPSGPLGPQLNNTLVELRMCLSLELEPIPCPDHLNSTCGDTVRLPKGKPVEAACSKYFPLPGQARMVDDLVWVADGGVAVADGRDSSSTGVGLQAEE